MCVQFGFTRRAAIRDQKARINWRIRVPQVRLIDDQGQQVGVITTQQALQMAEERGLDLVEVAPNADPPVCRLMDYGKYRYDQAKKDREARKNQKIVEVKEIRMKPVTDEHDLEVKSNQARRFLGDGDKVRFTVRMRGRQLAHPDIGVRMLEDLAERLRDVAAIEQRPMAEGKAQTMVLAPSTKSAKRSERSSQSSLPARSVEQAEQAEAIEG
ncbi:MAG TPA: translation initiation factor IF-3 [Herpetosiphonaceae bacterium]|nr:translation initiation factor IF-3 [Herpetosiphonaceae bacterium]